MTDVRDTVQKIGILLRVEHATEINQDPVKFKLSVLALLKAELPPGRPGRPRSKIVDQATEIWTREKNWQRVFACLGISDQAAQVRLRSAVRGRINRTKTKSALNSSTNKAYIG